MRRDVSSLIAVDDGVKLLRSVIAVSDNPKAAGANPKDFFVNRFIKELEDSGFIKELYGQR